MYHRCTAWSRIMLHCDHAATSCFQYCMSTRVILPLSKTKNMPQFFIQINFVVFYRCSACKNILWKTISLGYVINIFLKFREFQPQYFIIQIGPCARYEWSKMLSKMLSEYKTQKKRVLLFFVTFLYIIKQMKAQDSLFFKLVVIKHQEVRSTGYVV